MADISIAQRRGFTEVIIKNEMTIYSAMDDFTDHIKSTKYKKMVNIDLSGVSEIDTAGIQILIALFKFLSGQDHKFTITSLSDTVSDYIELFQLHSTFHLKADTQ